MSDAKKIRQAALFDEKRKTLENLVVLYLTQAMLGLVSPNLRVVAVDVGPERAVVHFAFAEDRPEDREDVEDILADLDALLSNEDLPKDWTIEPAFYIGNRLGLEHPSELRRLFGVRRSLALPRGGVDERRALEHLQRQQRALQRGRGHVDAEEDDTAAGWRSHCGPSATTRIVLIAQSR
jgi:hypothetical protein